LKLDVPRLVKYAAAVGVWCVSPMLWSAVECIWCSNTLYDDRSMTSCRPARPATCL